MPVGALTGPTGKPVKIRRGPAAVTGKPYRPRPLRKWEGLGARKPGSQKTCPPVFLQLRPSRVGVRRRATGAPFPLSVSGRGFLMRYWQRLQAAFAVVLLISTALGEATPAAFERIIAFTPSSVEIIYALGAEDRLVGIGSYADYPPQARREKPTVGGIVNPDIERIVSLAPDIIISNISAMARTHFSRLDLNHTEVPDTSLDDILASFVRIGEIAGRTDEGHAMARRLAAAVEQARSRLAERRKISTLVVIGYEPLWVVGGSGYLDELLRAAGGTNAAGAIKRDFYAIDFERVIASAPECIIDLTLKDAGDERGRAMVLAFWNRFRSIPAVAAGRIEFVDTDLLTIPGPRLQQGIERLQAALHGPDDNAGGGE